MPTVFLSGTVDCIECDARYIRADLLYILFRKGWNILNANGDETITLGNIEDSIIEADAFLFSSNPGIEELFKAVSVFVGYQTLDPNLEGKPTLLLNGQGSWNNFLAVLDQLQKNDTIHQNHRDFLLQVPAIDEVLPTLEKAQLAKTPDPGREKVQEAIDTTIPTADTPAPADLLGRVCVFCSASIKDEAQLQAGYDIGKLLADNNYGCVSGAGRTGIMGTVVAGSVEAGGWTAGSNVPHIIELEGLPDGLSCFWLRPDIYTRMEVMIENSDAFLILPGGAGTVQELLALLLLRAQNDPLMADKPIIIYNPLLADGTRFWDSLITLLGTYDKGDACHVITDKDQLIGSLGQELKK